MNKNKKLFIIFFIIFVLIVGFLTYDMATKTVAPWEKEEKKSGSSSS